MPLIPLFAPQGGSYTGAASFSGSGTLAASGIQPGPGINPALIRKGTKADALDTDTTINPGYPATVVAGELLLLIQSKADGLASLTGWVPVDDAFDSSIAVAQVFSRVADGTETGTLAVPNTSDSTAQIIAIPGGSTITTSKAATSGTTASLTLPAIPAVAGSVLIYMVAGPNVVETFTGDEVAHIEIEDFVGAANPAGRSGAIYRDIALNGTGTRTVTPTEVRRMAAVMVRVAPVGVDFAGTAGFSGGGSLSATGVLEIQPQTAATLSGSGTLSVSSRNLFHPSAISSSFEDGTTLGWANRSNVASLASVVGNAEHGTRSMRVTGSAAGTVQVITSDFHPCTVGLYYAFSFHATSTLTFQMWIDWYDSSGTYLTYSGVGLGAPVGGASRFKWEAILPPTGATQFKTYIEALSVPANGSFYLDAIQYEQAYYATPYDAGVGTPGLTPTRALSGSGTLTAATTPRPVRTAALSGSGSLSTTRTPNTSASVALSGDGSLTASGVAATANFAGTATLSGSGTLAVTNSFNLFHPSAISTSFEDGTTLGWANRSNVASLASVVGNAGHGSRSMQVTATAAGGTVGVITSGFHPGTAGLSYYFGLYAATTLSFQIWVDWYDSAGTYLSTTGSGLGAPAGGAARLGNWFNAPASATQFKVFFEAVSVPANGIFHVDAFQYEQATSGTAYAPGDAGTPGFSAAAAFSGSGTLSATATPRPTQTASFSGSGTLSATQVPRPTQAVSFSGSGSLSAAATTTPTQAVSFSGSGTLSATRTPAISVSAPLSGSGTLTASGVATTTGFAGTTTLSGSGTLSTTQTPRPVRIAALSGSGTLITSSVIPDVVSDADWILSAQLLDGGICQYPDKTYIVPYFAHLAALGLARATEVTGNQSYATASWDWLDWYVAHMDATGFVTDYNVAPTTQALTSTGDMDSTDSYAALFLHAAYKTWKVTGDTTRLSTLSTGLSKAMTAIEATQEPDGLTWAKPAYHVKYLMDQVEVYAGVQAAYALGGVIGSATLQSRALASSVALVAGVETMWNSTAQSYYWARHENGVHETTDWTKVYPDSWAQVWGVAFGLVRGTRATALVNKYDIEHPLWDQPTATNSNGVGTVGYQPVVGLAFMLVGQIARSQLAARRIRAAATNANRAWSYNTSLAGELILLESTDLSYLAPVVDKSSLSGSGTLSTGGSSSLTSSLSGSGSLSTTATPRPARTAAFSGSGSLSTIRIIKVSGTAALSGTGTLGSSGVNYAQISLSGLGTLATTEALSVLGSTIFTGSGLLTAVGSVGGSAAGTDLVIRFGSTTYIMRVGSSQVYLRTGR